MTRTNATRQPSQFRCPCFDCDCYARVDSPAHRCSACRADEHAGHLCRIDECAHTCWRDGKTYVKPLNDGETWCDCALHRPETEAELRYAWGDR